MGQIQKYVQIYSNNELVPTNLLKRTAFKLTHLMKRSHTHTALALIAAACLAACSGTTELNPGLVSRLKNRGPVALSGDNPYLAANMFVASTAENSPVIRGFVKRKGAPTAVEIDQQIFSPMVLYFYYLKDREFYKLEEALGTWIIQGPSRIGADMLVDLAKSSKDLTGPPALIAEEENTSSSLTAPSSTPEITADTPEQPVSPDHLKQMADEREELYKSSFKSVAPRPKPNNPGQLGPNELATLQKAADGHPAELAPNGDLVHHVTYPGETLSAVSLWYTHDGGNAGRLARMNSIKDPDLLQPGDTVIIPAYLVKNGNRLTEQGLAAVKK